MNQKKTSYNPSIGLYVLGAFLLILISSWYLIRQYIAPQLVNSVTEKVVTTAADQLQETDFSQASTTTISSTVEGEGVAMVINANQATLNINTKVGTKEITGEIKYFDGSGPALTSETKTMPGNNNVASFMTLQSDSKESEQYNLHIPQEMPVALQINIGAGILDLDLTGSQTEFVTANLGAGNIEVTFPSETSVEATFNTGAGDINLHVPKNMGKQIIFAQGVPADLNLGGDFVKTENGFLSKNYETATFKANITLVQAVGGFTINTIE